MFQTGEYLLLFNFFLFYIFIEDVYKYHKFNHIEFYITFIQSAWNAFLHALNIVFL